MLKFGNKEFRNLQEQVLKNMRDIANIRTSGIVLDEFGIKVVGQESSVANMPSVADYKLTNPDWAYGDAYAIGTEAPYTLYILTREDANHTDDYWFNIGRFPEPGPQGPKGDTGDTGPQGQTGNPGADGAAAGFGAVTATAVTLEPSEEATVSVVASGPNTEKSFAFTFGIPKGKAGESGTDAIWGNITGDISNQTDLVSSLQAKQNLLVSGTNIKTINNESILGSGNIVIQGGSGNITDVKVNGVSVVDQDGVAKVTVPTKTSDLANDSGFITSSALSGYATQSYVQSYHDSTKQDVISDLSTIRSGAALGATAVQPAAIADMATETWVGQQGYLTSVSWSDVSGKPTFATVATSGSYNDLSDKPTIPVVDYPVTDVEVNGSSVLSGTVAQITVPTATSDLTNDSGFITSSYHDATKQDVISDLSTIRSGAALGATAVQPAALSNYVTIAGGTNLNPEIITGVKNFKNDVWFTANGDLDPETQLGGGISNEMSNDVNTLVIYSDYKIDLRSGNDYPIMIDGHNIATESWVGQQGYATSSSLAIVATSGSYNDLSNKPTIPTKTSDLTNDSGYITSSALSDYVDLTTAQSISGRKTFNSGISIGYSRNVCGHIEGNNTTELIIKSATTLSKPNNAQVYLSSAASGNKPIVTVLANIEPYNDNDTDLGRTNRKWKDLYLAGNLTDGTNSIAIADIANKSAILGTSTETWTFTLSDNTTVTKTVVLG